MAGGDYKSTTRVEADSESDSSLSDSFLDVPRDLSRNFSTRRKGNRRMQLSKSQKIPIKCEDKIPNIEQTLLLFLDAWSCTLFPRNYNNDFFV